MTTGRPWTEPERKLVEDRWDAGDSDEEIVAALAALELDGHARTLRGVAQLRCRHGWVSARTGKGQARSRKRKGMARYKTAQLLEELARRGIVADDQRLLALDLELAQRDLRATRALVKKHKAECAALRSRVRSAMVSLAERDDKIRELSAKMLAQARRTA